MKKYQSILEFQGEYPSREAREEFIRTLTNEEIDELIDLCDNIQGKIWYSRLKKQKPDEWAGGDVFYIFL